VGFSVVVNDFENAEVDAARLRALGAEVQAISGSCVCCSSLNEFLVTLRDIEVPEEGVLLVEANGASDQIALIAAVTMRSECRRFMSPLQVTIVDAQRWQQRRLQNVLETEQVLTSTHWFLSHQAGVVTERHAEVREAVRRLAPRAVETGVEDFARYVRLVRSGGGGGRGFFGQDVQGDEERKRLAEGHAHHHEEDRAFTSMRVALPLVVERQELEQVLESLPESVIRVKGLCRLAEIPQVPMSFQHVRPEAATWFLPLLDVSGVVPSGVVIGVGMPVAEIASAFETLPSAELDADFSV
jgi:G3E family GTPase